MNYEETLELARKTGKGVNVRFQEKPNYILVAHGFNCPHCGSWYGHKKGKEYTNEGARTVDVNIYETLEDIRFMATNIQEVVYMWTEDCKCGNCEKMYSQTNRC